MRRIFHTAVVALLACGCASRSQKPAPVTNRVIEIGALSGRASSDTLRLGVLHAGETVVQNIDIFNAGDVPAVVTRTECGCACLSLELNYSPLGPQERRTMKLTFDTGGLYGTVLRRADIYVAGEPKPYGLWIEADVR